MTVEDARARYQAACTLAVYHAACRRWRGTLIPCQLAHGYWLRVDAASIQLDLVTAETVARKSVAY